MEYKIIDNFISNNLFNNLSSLKLTPVRNDEIINHHNKFFKDGSAYCTCLDFETIKKLQYECHHKAIKILKEFAPNKVDLYEYSDFNIIETGKDYSFPIHRDEVNKLLSGVIYLNPTKNTGTILYENKKGRNPYEISWKQNRGFFFSRTEETTWHNYKGDGINNRIVLVYNLMTKNTKKVCEIDNLNYNSIRFREKVNPYLYRFFKRYL